MSWPNSKSISSVVSSLPLLELSLHTNQTDFPSLSRSISFHNKNQFSVTLSSTVKVNSPHADIHIQISPSVTQHHLVHAPSASIQPTIKSLWIDLVYPQTNKINPHSHLLDQFPHPGWNLFPLADHPVPPWITQKCVSTLICALQKLWSPPTSTSLSSFYFSFPPSYSLFPTGRIPGRHILFSFSFTLCLCPGSLTQYSFLIQCSLIFIHLLFFTVASSPLVKTPLALLFFRASSLISQGVDLTMLTPVSGWSLDWGLLRH